MPTRSARCSRGTATKPAAVTSRIHWIAGSPNGCAPRSGNAAVRASPESSAHAATTMSPRPRVAIARAVLTRARNAPASGLVSTVSALSPPPRAGRSDCAASSAARPTATPRAKVRRPENKLEPTPTANHRAPTRPPVPKRSPTSRSKSTADTTIVSAPAIHRPSAAATAGATTLYPGVLWPPYHCPSHRTSPWSATRSARKACAARSGLAGCMATYVPAVTDASPMHASDQGCSRGSLIARAMMPVCRHVPPAASPLLGVQGRHFAVAGDHELRARRVEDANRALGARAQNHHPAAELAGRFEGGQADGLLVAQLVPGVVLP